MRTTPLVGRKAWFGPRRLGWGLAPVSPEGWAVVGVGLVVTIGLATLGKHDRWTALIVVAVLLTITFLKGTSPGGPSEWQEFQAQRGNGDGQDNLGS
jgi:hypothetical protein